MVRIADEQRLPFDVKVPNATTRKAIVELEAGKGKKFASVDDLMADLHAAGARSVPSFLARDITRHPERLQSVDAGLVQRLQSLVGGVDVDLDAALSADDE